MLKSRKLIKLRSNLLLPLGLVFLLFGFNSAVKKDLEIALEGKKIDALSGTGLTINFLFRVVNSSSLQYQLIKSSQRTLINQQEFFRLETLLEKPIDVPSQSSIFINLPVRITYAYLFQTLPALKETEKFTCNLIGWLTLVDPKRREQKISFVATADFPLFKEWPITFEPLQVKALSLGGADLLFTFSLTNNNSFTWILRSIEGHLELAEKKVGSVSQTFQVSLAPGESKQLVIPLLLDFFELGRELQSFLEASDIEASIFGHMEIESEWGRFQLPVSVKGKVPIIRNDLSYYSHL